MLEWQTCLGCLFHPPLLWRLAARSLHHEKSEQLHLRQAPPVLQGRYSERPSPTFLPRIFQAWQTRQLSCWLLPASHKVTFHSGTCKRKSANSLRGLYFFGHDIECRCLSSQWGNSIECIECARICFQEPICATFAPAKTRTYIFLRGLRGNGHRTNLFLQVKNF